jgi:hypothetical protein
MKKFCKFACLGILLAMLVFACQKSEQEDVVPGQEALTVAEAKEWYERTQPAVVLPGQEEMETEHPEDMLTVVQWNKAKVSKEGDYEVVEALIYSDRMVFYAPDAAISDAGTSKPLSSVPNGISRLVVLRVTSTGYTRCFVQTFAVNRIYTERPNFKRNLLRNCFFQYDRTFSGTDYISTVEGDFMRAYVVEKGVRVKRTGIPEKKIEGTEPRIQRLSYICGYTTHWATSWYCENSAPGNSMEDGVDVHCWSTETPYQVPYYCYDDEWNWGNDSGGSGSSGGSGGSGGSGSNPPSTTPNADQLYASTSTLSASEKKKLYDALDEFKNKYPAYSQVFKNLVTKGIKIKFSIDPTIGIDPTDPTIAGALAVYGTNKTIRFKSAADINCDNLQEELIHAIQHDKYETAMVPTVRNYEFEAKVFRDLACPNINIENLCSLMGFEESDAFQNYSKWVLDCAERHTFLESDIAQFSTFCSNWTVYERSYDASFVPNILKEYFNP